MTWYSFYRFVGSRWWDLTVSLIWATCLVLCLVDNRDWWLCVLYALLTLWRALDFLKKTYSRKIGRYS